MIENNYFYLFGLPCQFEVDIALLDHYYRKLQNQVHPDKFINASPAERLQSMQTSALANEAYQTLKHPTARARYLLTLQGIDTEEESNTIMPGDFLMAQMEWRENIDEAKQAKDISALEQQRQLLRQETKQLHVELAQTISVQPELSVLIVRKLSFIDKASADINAIIHQLTE